ncbi:MAG: hypothetical protein MUE85_07060 [Microscillaceae bacterium]|jgi:hypothetical protein|nr:hypothetical protein [Microscillaceae bacterium]
MGYKFTKKYNLYLFVNYFLQIQRKTRQVLGFNFAGLGNKAIRLAINIF